MLALSRLGRVLPAIAVFLCCPLLSAYAQRPRLAGSEARVNAYNASDQLDARVTAIDGGFVVVWSSRGQDGNGFGVYAQRFLSDGRKTGGNFRVNVDVANDQRDARVARLPNGGFVVIWRTVPPSSSPTLGQIYAQRYDRLGNRLGGNFLVAPPFGGQSQPSVASFANGRFVVTWANRASQARPRGIYGQRFKPNGERLGPRFRVSPAGIPGGQNEVAVLSDRGFIVVWRGPQGTGVSAQRYTASGSRMGGRFRAHPRDAANFVRIAALGGGGFVLAWDEDPSCYCKVFYRQFNNLGVAVAPARRVNRSESYVNTWPTVTALPDLGFLVAWSSQRDGSLDILGQRYTALGERTSRDFKINIPTADIQHRAALATLDTGFVASTFESYSGALGAEVYRQRIRVP